MAVEKSKNYIKEIEKELVSLNKIQEDGFLKMRIILIIDFLLLFIPMFIGSMFEGSMFEALAPLIFFGVIVSMFISFIKNPILFWFLMFGRCVGIFYGLIITLLGLGGSLGWFVPGVIILITNILFIYFGLQVFKTKTKIKLLKEQGELDE